MAFTDNISTPRTSEREFTAMGNNSSTEQIMDLITVQLSTDTTSLSTKELSSVKTDSELSSTNPAKIAFTTPYEITEDSSVTVTKEEMVFLTPTVVEIISSPNEANENPTPDLMEITPFLNETTPDRKFDVSTFGEIDTFTKSLGINITSNTQTKENESTPVEYNNSITTNTNSLSMNETFITGDITFVTQPNQTMTNPADISKEVEFTIPSTADSQTKFEENTYDVINYDFTSSPNSIISNESFSVLLSTESSRTEQQENKSTVELTSSEMQITSTDGDFQSFSPSKAFNNMTFKHGELVSSPNTLSSDRTNEMTMKTGDVSEILTSSFEANFISGSTIAQLAVTEDLETKQTKDVNVTSVVDLETVYSISKNMNISGIESTLENNSEASSKPSSYELTTIVEEVNSNGLSTASNILNSNDVSSTNYSLLSTLQTSLGITGNETISETLYTSQSEQTFTNKAEFFSTLQSAVENATLPKGAHSTQAQGHFFQNLSRDSLTLDIILSTLPKTVTEAKPSTQFTLQKYSDLSWVSTTQSEPSTNAITQLINLSTNTIKYSSLKTPPTTTEDVNLTEKSDNYMSNTQMGEYSNYTHVSKPQTTLIDVGSQSESSGLSTTKHQQQSTNFLSENVTESTSLPPTNEHPTLPLSVSTSQQAHISFESSISPTTISVFSSSVAKGTPLPSSSTTSVSHTCQSRYFLDKIGELVIEVKSKFKFYVVKKELMDTVGEYEVTDAQVKFNFTFIDNMYIVWMRFDSRTLPLKIIEIREITVKVCNSLQLSSSGTKNVELHKELTSGSFAVIVVALLYFSILLIIAFILIHRKYKQRLKVGSTEYLSEKTCSTRATLETNLEIESEC